MRKVQELELCLGVAGGRAPLDHPLSPRPLLGSSPHLDRGLPFPYSDLVSSPSRRLAVPSSPPLVIFSFPHPFVPFCPRLASLFQRLVVLLSRRLAVSSSPPGAFSYSRLLLWPPSPHLLVPSSPSPCLLFSSAACLLYWIISLPPRLSSSQLVSLPLYPSLCICLSASLRPPLCVSVSLGTFPDACLEQLMLQAGYAATTGSAQGCSSVCHMVYL